MRSRSISAALRPISTGACLIVVSEGRIVRVNARSANPITERSSGIFNPSSSAALYTPIAIESFPANSAVGRSLFRRALSHHCIPRGDFESDPPPTRRLLRSLCHNLAESHPARAHYGQDPIRSWYKSQPCMSERDKMLRYKTPPSSSSVPTKSA